MAFEDLLTSQVRRKLTALRGLLRAHLVGRGMCWVVVAVVTAVFFTFGVDYLLHMDLAQRALIDAVALAGIAYVCWRFLFRPLRVPMGAEDLALVLEDHYPQLDDRLISALQFASSETSRVGASESMIRKVAEQANQAAGSVHPGQPVASAGTWKRMGFPGAALVGLIVFTVFNADLMGRWFQRNVLLANVSWPQETYLRVAGGPEFKVIRGGTLAVEVTASGPKLPPRVTFHMEFASLPGEVKEAVAATEDRTDPLGDRTRIYVKKMENVAEGFKFYVTGNDARTKIFEVIVVRPPELVELAGVKHFPDYMSRPPGEFRPEHGLIAVPAGGRLFFTGRADKDLSAASLRLDGEVVAKLQVKKVTSDEDLSIKGRPRALEGTLQLLERIGKPSMVLEFELTDTEGITNPRGAAYSLRIDPDRPPGVSLTRRSVRGEVTAVAYIPVVVQARDDCGVAKLYVSAQPVRGEEGTTLPAPRDPSQVTGFNPGERDVRAEHTEDLRPLGLKVGHRVRIHGIAHDTLPKPYGGPNVGRSVVQTFKIVSPEEIMEELVRRQREVRQEFARAVVLQAGVRDGVRAVGDRLGTAGADVETQRRLQAGARDQRRVATACAVAVQQLEGVVAEMTCNRVDTAGEGRRLTEIIIRPLDELSKKAMTDVAAAMDRASNMKDVGPLREFVADATGILDGLVKRLEDILEQMKKLESRQELAYRLKIIIDLSGDIERAIKELLDEETRRLFDEKDKKKP